MSSRSSWIPTLGGIARSQLADAANVQIVNTDVLSGKGTINPIVTEALAQAQVRLGETGPVGPMGPMKGSVVDGRLLLVSNLPYDVASSVMINLVKGPVTADAMCVTVQKEVAERMTAPAGRPGLWDAEHLPAGHRRGRAAAAAQAERLLAAARGGFRHGPLRARPGQEPPHPGHGPF